MELGRSQSVKSIVHQEGFKPFQEFYPTAPMLTNDVAIESTHMEKATSSKNLKLKNKIINDGNVSDALTVTKETDKDETKITEVASV